MKCRKCGTENIANAKFCRHCGDSLVMNIMDLYPKINFVPTNFMDWKKPNVGRFIKVLLSIPICILLFLCIYCLWSYNVYNQRGRNTCSAGNEELKMYCTLTEDPLMDGGLEYVDVYSYKFNDGYYSDFEYVYDDNGNEREVSAGEYISNPVEWTAEKSLFEYRRRLVLIFMSFACGAIALFLIMHFVICGYPQRPKRTKPLSEVADYCQKYSYWGIFRRRKTPKFVFFIKDGQFGILDVAHYSVFLPARYDFLSWREKNKYLNAVINGRNVIIDIYGKELK